MTVSPERALIAAVRDALAADAGVRAVLGDPARVYEARPAYAAFPHAAFGQVESRAGDSSDHDTLETTITLDVWSRESGRAEALDIVHALRAAVHGAPLALEGRRLVLLCAVVADVIGADDAKSVRGVLKLHAVTAPLH